MFQFRAKILYVIRSYPETGNPRDAADGQLMSTDNVKTDHDSDLQCVLAGGDWYRSCRGRSLRAHRNGRGRPTFLPDPHNRPQPQARCLRIYLPLRRASAIAASRARSSAFDGSETRKSMPPTSVTPALTRRSRA